MGSNTRKGSGGILKIEWYPWHLLQEDEEKNFSVLWGSFIKNKDACRVCLGNVDGIEVHVCIESSGDDMYTIFMTAKDGGCAIDHTDGSSFDEIEMKVLTEVQKWALNDRKRNQYHRKQIKEVLEKGRVPIIAFDYESQESILEIFPARSTQRDVIWKEMSKSDYIKLEKQMVADGYFTLDGTEYEAIDLGPI